MFAGFRRLMQKNSNKIKGHPRLRDLHRGTNIRN